VTREERIAFIRGVLTTSKVAYLSDEKIDMIVDRWGDDSDASFERGIEAEQAVPRYPYYGEAS